MPTNVNYELYLVTEEDIPIEQLFQVIKEAVRGGVTLVQLREKKGSGKLFYEKALQLKAFLDPLSIPLIINDRIDIALAVDAAGVHVGQSDLPVAAVKKIVPPSMVVGVSVQTVDQAQRAEAEGADYIGVGALFPTATKSDANLLPKGMLKKISQAVSIPTVAIGGIRTNNIQQIERDTIDGVAVVSAITRVKDPKSVAERLVAHVRRIRK